MKKSEEIELAKELRRMLERMKLENKALLRLIEALKENGKADYEEFLKKSNQ